MSLGTLLVGILRPKCLKNLRACLPRSVKAWHRPNFQPVPVVLTPLLAPTPPEPETPAAEPATVESKENSLTGKLQAPDKEATVGFTVDMSVGASGAGGAPRKQIGVLLFDGLKELSLFDELPACGDRCLLLIRANKYKLIP